jgi:gluconate kinase
VGRLLADRLSCPFYDADDFHPACSVQKMRAGQALSDEDRQPWLHALNALLADHASR